MLATDAITHGIYLIGSGNAEKKNLMTAAWMAQTTSDMIMLAVGKRHCTAELIRESGHFSVSVLSVRQKDAAWRCGTASGRNTNKLENLPVYYTKQGDPVLEDAVAYFSCRVEHMVDRFDHVVFFGRIIDSDYQGGVPLLYKRDEWFS